MSKQPHQSYSWGGNEEDTNTLFEAWVVFIISLNLLALPILYIYLR